MISNFVYNVSVPVEMDQREVVEGGLQMNEYKLVC